MKETEGLPGAALCVVKDGKKLRIGFTTGTCAAAAAAAAARMLMTGDIADRVQVRTPGGPVFHAQVLNPRILRGSDGCRISASCSIRKDGGDDPDVTTGTQITAEVSVSTVPGIVIDGGCGIGRVTMPGLDQPVGEAAINRVPRQMITENTGRILQEWQETDGLAPRGLLVIISAPEGEKLAEKTFNPRLGIQGGISILGTTGLVEPMSDRALIETIRTQMRMKRALGQRFVITAPGNYGLAFLEEKYGLSCQDQDPASGVIMISNFVGEAARMAADSGFEGILLAGHLGKLIKVAGGVPDTHSRYGDKRMEILWETASPFCGSDDRENLKKALFSCVMTDAALDVLRSYGILEETAEEIVRRIIVNLEKWSGSRLRAETIVFSHQNRELASSKGAAQMLGFIREG